MLQDESAETLVAPIHNPPAPLLLAEAPVTLDIATNQSLSSLMGWRSPRLLTLLGRNKREHYSKLFIRKKGVNGKLRVLYNPDRLMRAAQFLILTRILETIRVPDYIHAFERGRSIPAMAQQHVGKGVIISLDLKDFFTSIKQRHLQEIFQHLGVSATPARTLSELCTYESFVPQGALTSPKLSNIVSSLTFGPILKQYCDERGYTLSIYADDITISCEEDIVAANGYGATQEIIGAVTQCVAEFGFRVNRRKTKVMRPFQRQYVCGVVVNERTNLQQRERRRLRAIVHNCLTHGIEAEAAKNGISPETFVSQIAGKINWFSQLNQDGGPVLMESFQSAVRQYQESPKETTTVESPAVIPQTPVDSIPETPWENTAEA